jgi:hypothetical protein
MINSQLDYIVGQDLVKSIKKSIGVAVTEEDLYVILKKNGVTLKIKKELNTSTRRVTAYYR